MITLLEQLAQSARSALWQTVPPFDFLSSSANVNANGLLGNTSSQSFVFSFDVDSVMETYRTLLSSAQPAFKLAILKRQKFTGDGREERIAASLAALNAPQPTELSLAQWKSILEEVEDED